MTDEHHIQPTDPDAEHSLKIVDPNPPPVITFHGSDNHPVVSINLETAELTIHDEKHKDDAPRIFWESIRLYGKTLVEQRNEAIELLRWYLNYDGDNGDGEFDERVAPFLARIDKEAD